MPLVTNFVLSLVAQTANLDSADLLAIRLNELTGKPVCLSLTQGRGKVPNVAVMRWDEKAKRTLADNLNLKLTDGKAVVLSPNQTVIGRYTSRGAIATSIKSKVESTEGLRLKKLKSGEIVVSTDEPIALGLWQLEELGFKSKPTFHWWVRSHLVKVHAPKPMLEADFLALVAGGANADYKVKNGRARIDLNSAEFRREWQNYLASQKTQGSAIIRGVADTSFKALPMISDGGIYGLMSKFGNTVVEKKFVHRTAVHESAWQFIDVWKNADDIVEASRDPKTGIGAQSIETFRRQRENTHATLDATAPVKVVFDSYGIITVYVPNVNGVSYSGFLPCRQQDIYAAN